MDLYNMLSNISNIDIETEIKNAITKIKKEYNNLTTDRTCFIYSSLIYEELSKKHILTKIISTKDFNMEYEHRFILIPYQQDNYFLIDLTYQQFFNKVPTYFQSLIENGYQLVTKDDIKFYIDLIINATSKKITNNEQNKYSSK